MNPISAFFVRNIIFVFFVYGLAFFVMGLALALASRHPSEFRFVQAIRPLAAFGILHGLHEWFEMYQKIGSLTSGYVPSIAEETVRLLILGVSFSMLLAFGTTLLDSGQGSLWRRHRPVLLMVGLWGVGTWTAAIAFRPMPDELLVLADVLLRYGLGIPGALLGTWALMVQQRTFREHGMPQFGRDLVWCATALLLYGVIGQLFVRPTVLVPSTFLNSTRFLQWFGIPVQLFRGVMAAILTFYMVRALRAFDLEDRRRLEEANRTKLAAQARALAAERRISQEKERLNEELRLTARELSLLLDLSNLLAANLGFQEKLSRVLEQIVRSLAFPDAGMILLVNRETGALQVQASSGFSESEGGGEPGPWHDMALDLAGQCVAKGLVLCRHVDGRIIEFVLDEVVAVQECWQYTSPTVMVGLPLVAGQQVIGSVVLARPHAEEEMAYEELKLMVGIGRQLGLFIENARLSQLAQERETLLGELLYQVVGAQEAERQRIARELHDATGQSLTAIALGLRGIEMMLAAGSPEVVGQIREVASFSISALAELRRLIADLRPPQLDDLGLVAALKWYVQAFEERYAVHTEFTVTGAQARLPSEYETVIFRIVQEALTNIAKHANASQAQVKLERYPAQICVSVTDDGCGFDPREVLSGRERHEGWGLLGIRERTLLLGGQYAIDSAPGRGTRIGVSIPLMVEADGVKDTAVAG